MFMTSYSECNVYYWMSGLCEDETLWVHSAAQHHVGTPRLLHMPYDVGSPYPYLMTAT